MRVTSRARDVEVPNLYGKSIDEARTLLAGEVLTVRVEDARRPDKAVPPDHVLTQEPAGRPDRASSARHPGQAERRHARGPRCRSSPSSPSARPKSRSRVIGSPSATRPKSAAWTTSPGVVVSQDPPARQRAESVNLLINRSEGPSATWCPICIGTLGIRSADVLRGLGFRVAVAAEVPYPGLPPGIVVRQTPQPGFQIAANETITLEVSK
jgi:beta-lactam-binding protein with PASTA domain